MAAKKKRGTRWDSGEDQIRESLRGKIPDIVFNAVYDKGDDEEELKRLELDEARLRKKAREDEAAARKRELQLEMERERDAALEIKRQKELEADQAHEYAIEMKREEQYDKSFRGRFANMWSRFKNRKSGDEGEKQTNQQQSQPTQQQSGGGTFASQTIRMAMPKSNKGKIFAIIAILIGIFLLWWYNLLTKQNLAAAIPYIVGFLFLVLIFLGFRNKGENSSYVAWALLIWAIDLLPAKIPYIGYYLGPAYAGFNLGFAELARINWLPVVTFPLFVFAIFYGGLREFLKKRYWVSLMFFGLMFLLNKLLSVYSISIIEPSLAAYVGPILNGAIFVFMLLVLFLAWKYGGRNDEQINEFVSYMFLVLTGSFFLVNNSWMSSTKAWLHMLFILAFGLGYVKKKESANVWKIWIPVFLILDFFLYNLTAFLGSNISPVIQMIPMLVSIVLIYCYIKTPDNNYVKFTVVFIIAIILLLWAPSASGGQGFQFKENQPGSGLGDFFSGISKGFSNLFSTTVNAAGLGVTKRLDYATGGLYNGYVEQNQYENLGVYFANVRASEPKFYTDEPVVLYGSIQSKTYQDPVIVDFQCYRWANNDKTKIYTEDRQPKTPFLAFQLEENDVECSFLPKDSQPSLEPGYNKITLEANYNFSTDAYLKSYYIDKEKRRNLVRQNINPLAQLGIEDKNPKPVFTNGPVEIGISVQPLISVSKDSDQDTSLLPTISVSLINRQQTEDKDNKVISQWDGNIKQIKELVILTPPNVVIGDVSAGGDIDTLCNPENYGKHLCPCNRPFKKYTEADCKTSCTNNVKTPCDGVCKNGKDCVSECARVYKNCNDECDNLFKADDSKQVYNGYSLDFSNLKFNEEYKNIGTATADSASTDTNRYRTFTCYFKPLQSVLDNVPITTRYFRVRARYDYLLQKTFQVAAEQPPGSTSLIQADQQCGDLINQLNQISGDNLDPDLIKAIAWIESNAQHCQKGADSCSPNLVTNSGRDSVGIMGVNVGQGNHPEWKTDASKICGKKEDGQPKTVYDYDCNVKLGKYVLVEEKYKPFKDGIPPNKLACSTTSPYHDIYLSYKGWAAALRGYNGLGCTIGADTNYVCEVTLVYSDIKSQKRIVNMNIPN